ncbi:MAG TPA: hypothetical protein VNM90_12925, partial [Haliangium sp.]|nr:hypothetical protein [Haliangium sp.]
MSRLRQELTTWFHRLQRARRRGGRKLSHHGRRIHVGLRDVGRREAEQLAAALEQALASVPGVDWVRVNAHLAHAVVACTPDMVREPEAFED